MNEEISRARLAPVARLLGTLLVRELDTQFLKDVQTPETRAILEECGVHWPEEGDLEGLAHEFCDRFLHPSSGMPPVESLWKHGQYDGDAKQDVQNLARAAGLTLGEAARGAPVDHLGCILLLWAEVAELRPEIAALIEEGHLAWGIGSLAAAERGGGFYGGVAAATRDFIGVIIARD